MERWISNSLVVALALVCAPSRASEPDLTTPRRGLRSFVDSARSGDYAAAARSLDLRAIPENRRAAEGPRLAREVKFVLDRELWLDWDRISDARDGDAADGPGADVIGSLRFARRRCPFA